MPGPTVAPYGSWSSPVSAAMLAERAVGISQLAVDGGVVYWNEARPSEGGRNVIVAMTPGEDPADVLPPPWSARTLVHEYGGRCYVVQAGTVWFSNFADQRLWRVGTGGAPEPVTAAPSEPRAVRYADPEIVPGGEWLVCVREAHTRAAVVNDLVAVSLTDPPGQARVLSLASGHDFYSAPRLSPTGDRLAWLSWDQPDMPWDGTELWVAELSWGSKPALGEAGLVAGGRQESVSQPRWSPDGDLHYVSDRTGWWNLYSTVAGALAPMAAEFSRPDWVFGQSTYCFVPGALVAVWSSDGIDRLGTVTAGRTQPRETGYTHLDSLQPLGDAVVALGGSPRQPLSVVRIPIDGSPPEVLKQSRPVPVDDTHLSVAEPIEFPTAGGRTAHALYYRPTNADFRGPDGERPPLVVLSHGGPTGATTSVINTGVQFLTSRGLAVVDVNYGGSSGYGRQYRDRLAGLWGVIDVDDCVNAAGYLAERGEVDGNRLAIRGGSAGGYTTLASLAFRDVFAVGASLYGVADLARLAEDTHKFEARYLDKLVGPYPERADLYRERSPLAAADRIACPVIFFQGLEDAVVPPAQSESMVAALRANGLPVAYLAFEGEQHGFRRADTIVRVAGAELYFYGRVLGFEPADEIEPVEIFNEDRLGQPASLEG
ncbi:MAG TPA: prolyl oligopeptidase family serine peptidase [Acidimicrobiales bacterium]|nr:prolyl oligopeptidase family serine peptidase [Acidimicrobiales bacterium]